MTSNSTDQPNAEQLAAQIDRLTRRIDSLQFWLDSLYRQTGKLAKILADHEGTEFNIGWREDGTEKDDGDAPGSAPGEFTSAQVQHLVNGDYR